MNSNTEYDGKKLNRSKNVIHNTIKLFGPIGILLQNNKSKAGFILLLVIIAFAIVGIFYTPYNPNAYLFARGAPPTIAHPLGTTAYGQDVFSQLLGGAAPTLMIAFSVGLLGTMVAVIVGLLAGFSSERTNSIINSIINIFLVIPSVLLIMLLGTFFLGIHESLSYISIILILLVTGWAFGARTFRSITMSIAKRDFITSSKLIGESKFSIIFRQIIKVMFPVIVSNFFFTAMYGTMGLTFVEYLGVGNLLQVNWGTMLYWAINNEAYLTGLWWWILPPSIMISILMFSFILMNFGMDEIANPSLRRFKLKHTKSRVKNEKI